MREMLLIIVFLLFSAIAFAEDQEIGKLFADSGVEGTMVISSLHGGPAFIFNAQRAKQRFPSASTFKILNTLIALEEKAVSGKDDLLQWDGHRYDFSDWNRDQTLESAFRVSCVWYYQELARRVGVEKYREYLQKSSYGRLREPFEVTTFWLDGSLVISALEQVAFLEKVYRLSLPFSVSTVETLKQIMVVEKKPDYTLRAKSGWATGSTPQVGWYVGYVETAKDVWFFAMNIDLRSAEELPLRQKLTREALRAKGIIE